MAVFMLTIRTCSMGSSWVLCSYKFLVTFPSKPLYTYVAGPSILTPKACELCFPKFSLKKVGEG